MQAAITVGDFQTVHKVRNPYCPKIVAQRRRKLASYEVAGNAPNQFMRPERTPDFHRPAGTFFILERKTRHDVPG
jgi:hypothetical protein